MRVVYLKPCEYYYGDRPVRVITVLGSCVAVTMYHRPSGLAAICHLVAPDCTISKGCTSECTQMGRYVNCMIPAMATSFATHGIRPAELEVKLFGGASMLDSGGRDNAQESLGEINTAMARKLLRQYGLTIKCADVGGHQGRKIIFDTRSGDVLLKRILPVSSLPEERFQQPRL